uniref:Uncharacterized protein n=1 Tax=Brassica campestris TaxID=3711 RepID=A0A3P6BXF4_BRACM|nr:unnamed protein product [Brassica rapa]
MCHKPNRDAECLRLCKESGPKTGFYFGTCAVKDNKHYCHCYNNICGPPLPPIKGPPPQLVFVRSRRKTRHQISSETLQYKEIVAVNGGFSGGLELDVIGKFGEDKDTSNCGGVHSVDNLNVTGVPPSGMKDTCSSICSTTFHK